MRLSVIGIVAALGLAFSARSGSADLVEVDKWFRSAWAEASQPNQILKAVTIRFDSEAPVSVTTEELEHLRAEVAGRPDHPKKAELAAQERRIASGVDKFENLLVWGNDAQWRFNVTNIGNPAVQYLDRARRADDTWTLTPAQLSVANGTSTIGGTYSISVTPALFAQSVGLLLFGGLGESSDGPLNIREVKATPTGYAALVANVEDTLRYEYAIQWLPNEQDGMVMSRICVGAPNRDYIGENITLSGRVHNATLRRWVYQQAERRRPNGIVSGRWKFVDAVPLSQSELGQALAIPTVGEPDIYRGDLTIEKIYDARANKSFSSDALRGFTPATGAAPNEIQNTRLRWLGWTAAGVIILGLVGLRARASRRRRARSSAWE